jgi:hypothetical protein
MAGTSPPLAAVFIGTFDPFHRGHYAVARAALAHLAPGGTVVCIVNSMAGGPGHYKPAALPAAKRRDIARDVLSELEEEERSGAAASGGGAMPAPPSAAGRIVLASGRELLRELHEALRGAERFASGEDAVLAAVARHGAALGLPPGCSPASLADVCGVDAWGGYTDAQVRGKSIIVITSGLPLLRQPPAPALGCVLTVDQRPLARPSSTAVRAKAAELFGAAASPDEWVAGLGPLGIPPFAAVFIKGAGLYARPPGEALQLRSSFGTHLALAPSSHSLALTQQAAEAESFEVEDCEEGDGHVLLRTRSSHRYLGAQRSCPPCRAAHHWEHTPPCHAQCHLRTAFLRSGHAGWERWGLELDAQGRLGLRSAHGTYLSARDPRASPPGERCTCPGHSQAAAAAAQQQLPAAEPVLRAPKRSWELWRPFRAVELALDIGGTRIKAAWRLVGAESLPMCVLPPVDTAEVFLTGPADAAQRLAARLPFATGQVASLAVAVCGEVEGGGRALRSAYNLSRHSDGGEVGGGLDLCSRLASAFALAPQAVAMVNDAVPPVAALAGWGAGGPSRKYVASMLPERTVAQLQQAGAPWPQLRQQAAALAIVLGTGVAVSYFDGASGQLGVATHSWAYQRCRVPYKGGEELVGHVLQAGVREEVAAQAGGREAFSRLAASAAHVLARQLRETLGCAHAPVALLLLGGGARHLETGLFLEHLHALAGKRAAALYPTAAVLSDDEGQRAFMLAGTLAVHHLALGNSVRNV